MSKFLQRLVWSLWFAFTVGLAIAGKLETASAAEPWSTPVPISDLRVSSSMAEVLVDGTGRVHVFWLTKLGFDSACAADTVVYMASVAGEWGEPRDILVSPRAFCLVDHAEAISPLDGKVHALWADYAQLYHSSARADEAVSPQAWSRPAVVAFDAGWHPDIVIDSQSRVHVAYVSNNPHRELYYTRSDDGGLHWLPAQLLHSSPETYRVDKTELALDGRGRLHLVWDDRLLAVGRGGTVYYTRSLDGGESWEPSLVVDEKRPEYTEDYGAGEIAITTVGDDEVHLVWNGPPSGHRWHQWSADGGVTWQPASPVAAENVLGGFGLRFYNGWQDLAADSAGRVHLLTSSAELVHMVWENGAWSDVESLLPFNPYWPRLAISEGNQLHAVIDYAASQDQSGSMYIWYMSLQTDAPLLPAHPLPEPPLRSPTASTLDGRQATDVVTGSPTPAPTGPRPSALAALGSIDESDSAGAFSSLFVGVAPAVLLVAAICVVQLWRQRR